MDSVFQTVLDKQSISYQESLIRQITSLLIQKKTSLSSVDTGCEFFWGLLRSGFSKESRLLRGSLSLDALETKIRLCQLTPTTVQNYGEFSLEACNELSAGARALFSSDLAVAIVSDFSQMGQSVQSSVHISISHIDFQSSKTYKLSALNDSLEIVSISALVLLKNALTLKV